MAMRLKSSDAPIFLLGATGAGKSVAALELARACPGGGAILALDAMQVYRGADIGTSKPTAAERAEIPHGGLDLADLGASFDVAQYLRHAEQFLREQCEAERRVIVVGGTGLYFRALTRGLCEAPQGPEELRAELGALSVEALRERLRKVDPTMLERLDVSNPRRLARAIEVKEATGRSLREWQEETPEPLVSDFTAYWICRKQEELRARIEARVEAMFAQGWVEEVRGLVERHGMEAVRGFAGIGYREIAERLVEGVEKAPSPGGRRLPAEAGTVAPSATATMGVDGGHRPPLQQTADPMATVESVKSDICVATRRYAKRQLTWFKREPKLQKVMLSGTQPLTAVLRTVV